MGKEKGLSEEQKKGINKMGLMLETVYNEKEESMFSQEVDLQITYNNYIMKEGGVGAIDEIIASNVEQVINDRDFFLEQFKDNQRKYDYERNCLANDKLKDILVNNNIIQYAMKNLKNKRIVKYQNALRFALFVLGMGMEEVCKGGEGFVVDWRRVRKELMGEENGELI